MRIGKPLEIWKYVLTFEICDILSLMSFFPYAIFMRAPCTFYSLKIDRNVLDTQHIFCVEVDIQKLLEYSLFRRWTFLVKPSFHYVKLVKISKFNQSNKVFTLRPQSCLCHFTQDIEQETVTRNVTRNMALNYCVGNAIARNFANTIQNNNYSSSFSVLPNAHQPYGTKSYWCTGV